jgi:hypothetical protein
MTVDPDAMKDALRACRTVAAVDACVRTIGAQVADMEADPVLYPIAAQIKNLAAYRRLCIRNRWTPQGHAEPERAA